MEQNYISNIPIALREAREFSGMSREELADRLGLSTKAIQNYEPGANLPRSDLSRRWCDACKYPFAVYLENVYHLADENESLDEDAREIIEFARVAPKWIRHTVADIIRAIKTGMRN